MIAVLAQVLALASGLLVNFLYPLVFGLAHYGEFLKYALPTLVLHRVVDMASESLIALPMETGFFRFSAICVGLMGLVAFLALWLAGVTQFIDLRLFCSLLATSVIMLVLHRDRRFGALASYLAIFNVSFCGVTTIAATTGALDLVDILVLTNLVGVIVGTFLLRGRVGEAMPLTSTTQTLTSVLKKIPNALGGTLSANAITNIFPLVVAGFLSAGELAKFRIFTSILQSSTSLFPLNTKSVLSLMREETHRLDFARWLDLAYWYFLLFAGGILVLSGFFPKWAIYGSAALMMIPFFWLVLLERYGITGGHSLALGKVGLIGLIVALLTCALWVRTEAEAVTAMCMLIAIQTTMLAAILLSGKSRYLVFYAAVLLSALVILTILGSWKSAWVVLLAVAYGLAFMRLSRAHLCLIIGREEYK